VKIHAIQTGTVAVTVAHDPEIAAWLAKRQLVHPATVKLAA
jgi:hypothetical protein